MTSRGRPPQKSPDLSDLELEVMGIVWRLGDCTSAQIIDDYRAKRPLADTTIRTVLANLRRKGFLELVPTVERTYVYRSAVSRESVARRVLRTVVDRLFGGSPQGAIAYLVEDQDLTETQLDEIRRMVEEMKRREP